jgi:hypothetical protein
MAMRIANQIQPGTYGEQNVESELEGMSLSAARKYLREEGLSVPASDARFIRQLREIGFTARIVKTQVARPTRLIVRL